MAFTIRAATPEDMGAIMDVETHSYLPELHAPREILENRLGVFGIHVAELGSGIVGFYTSVPAKLDWNDPQGFRNIFKENRNPHYTKWFDAYTHSKDGNALYVTSTAVHQDFQRCGIGKKLILHSVEQAKSGLS